MELKQVIVVRWDLKLSKGKLASQVAHASVSASIKSRYRDQWLDEGQKKVVLRCGTLDEILGLYEMSKKAGISSSLIRDQGRTEIPEGTITCAGIGPDSEEKIDRITGHLKLV